MAEYDRLKFADVVNVAEQLHASGPTPTFASANVGASRPPTY